MTRKPELIRDWICTPGAEWIVWTDPHSGMIDAFRVILAEKHRFLEWSNGGGFVAGASDEGDRAGRAKMTPVLKAQVGQVGEVAAAVLEVVAQLRREPPQMNGQPIRLPTGLLDLVSGLLAKLPEAMPPEDRPPKATLPDA